jgi:hypothetical protein
MDTVTRCGLIVVLGIAIALSGCSGNTEDMLERARVKAAVTELLSTMDEQRVLLAETLARGGSITAADHQAFWRVEVQYMDSIRDCWAAVSTDAMKDLFCEEWASEIEGRIQSWESAMATDPKGWLRLLKDAAPSSEAYDQWNDFHGGETGESIISLLDLCQ